MELLKQSYSYILERDTKNAILTLEKVLLINADNYIALNNLGLMETEIGNYDVAIEYYSRADKIDHNLSDIYYNWGLALTFQEKFSEAIVKFKLAFDMNPFDEDNIEALFLAFEDLSQYNEGVLFFEDAITNNKENSKIFYYYLSKLYELNKQPEKAKEAFKMSFELDSK